MTTRTNDKRRLAYLWKHRHNHDNDPDLQQQITVINQTIDNVAADTDLGAFIQMTLNSAQSIPQNGDPIAWTGTGSRYEFTAPTLPAEEITIPVTGYYDIWIQAGWSSWSAGGAVWVVVSRDGTGSTVWPLSTDPGLWTASNGQLFTDTAPAIHANAGDTISVYVDHLDSSAHDLESATLVIDLVERAPISEYYFPLAIAAGPVAYWRLDDTSGTTAVDSAGHVSGPHDGTYVNSPTLNSAGLMVDGTGSPSVTFNGTNQYVNCPQASVDGLSDLSIKAWINATSTSRMALFMVSWTSGGSFNRFGGWVLLSSNRFEWYEQNSGTFSAEILQTNTTHFIVVTRSAGGELKIYIDGVLNVTDSVTVNVSDSAAGDTAQIGVDYDGTSTRNDYWQGRIDELAIYDRVLDAGEIAAMYAAGA